MRCDEIQDRFIDLLYCERGTPPANPELQAHIDSCPTCRKELEELKTVQGTLRLWKDEPPLRPVGLGLLRHDYFFRPRRPALWSALRYAGIAAMLLIALLVLANPEIKWNKEGFYFKTSLPWGVSRSDYYTKAEARNLIKRALNDSETQMTETTRLMMDRLLDTIDQERWMDFRLVRHQAAQNRNKN